MVQETTAPVTMSAVEEAVAAFAVLVLRYTGQSQVAFEVSDDGAAPLHVQASEQWRLDAFMAKTRQNLRALAQAHGMLHLCWEEVRGAGHGSRLDLAVDLQPMQISLAQSMARGVLPADDGLAAVVQHFGVATQAVRRDTTARLADVPLVDGRERHLQLGPLSYSVLDEALQAPGMLHALFTAQAAQHPQRVAVEASGVQVTYAALDALSTQWALHLRQRGVHTGDLVGLLLPRGLDLYVAILGTLKAGATYVPLDPEWPTGRVVDILLDSHAKVLLTDTALRPRAPLPCPAMNMDEVELPEGDDTLPMPNHGDPEDLAYVIYTSGSTGKPKGVMVEHRSAHHFVRAEQQVFKLSPDDRVFQGLSAAFDASVEEMWLAWANGATLVTEKKDVLLTGLGALLTRLNITVLSTVPTLLSVIEDDLPSVRLLIVGGEACPQHLVRRWATARRAMFNTYGPTEATVVTTYKRLFGEEPVNIGRPLPNYRVYLLNKQGQLVPRGAAGEICVGGVGVARGYLGNAPLTAMRFVRNPFANMANAFNAPPRLYRTGDLGRYTATGDIEFLGRIDNQVKLRGFRIELGEIEEVLRETEQFSQVTVVLRDDAGATPCLVAYGVARAGINVDCSATLSQARARLPVHMVPAHLLLLETMPTLASGKVDNKALPLPEVAMVTGAPPQGALEETVAQVWKALLKLPQVHRDADFFRDLGGHSLLVAQMVSQLRHQPQFANLSVLDVYAHPTLADLATCASTPVAAPVNDDVPRSAWRHRLCGLAQLVGLYGIFGLHGAPWLAPYLVYQSLQQHGVGGLAAMCSAAAVLVLAYPAMLAVAWLCKWTVIGRFQAGRYPLWGAYYWRVWLVDRVLAAAPTWLLRGTPLLNTYYRWLGAHIGEDVHLATDRLNCFDLLHIDDHASLGVDADVRGFCVQGNTLVVGATHIGSSAVVGTRSVVDAGSRMEVGSMLADLSRLSSGHTVGAGQLWSGSPARPAGDARIWTPAPRLRGWQRLVNGGAYALLALALPGVVVGALVPGLAVLHAAEMAWGNGYLWTVPVCALLFVLGLCGQVAALRWLLLRRVPEGLHAVRGGLHLRKWVFDRAMDLSRDVLGGLYATLYVVPWLRSLGVRVGKNAEVSTASALTPGLLHIDDEAFIADSVSLSAPRLAAGWMELVPTRVGKRTFVGNSAVVAGGVRGGDGCLVGCLSLAPQDPHVASRSGATWLGSPAVELLQRQKSAEFPAELTYRPTRSLVIKRACIELLRVLMPPSCIILLTCLLLEAMARLQTMLPLGGVVALFPLLCMVMGLVGAGWVVAVKWLTMGRYRPREVPLWSTFVWRNEWVTAMHENVADPLLNRMLLGTPWAPWFFRALGARIGKRVYMGTTHFTEYDLIQVDDDVSLNQDCTLQTHLFEDRVMKMAPLHIGEGCTVGSDAVVLYDTLMEPGSQLQALSLLMKGETLPAHTAWEGTPARRVCA